MLLPGLAWWAWLGKRKQDPMVSLTQVLGISLAILILLAQIFYLVSLSLNVAGIWITLAGFGCLSAVGLYKKGAKLPNKFLPHLIIGIVLFSLVILWRLYQARDLLLPNWVDSQHHFLIVRVFLEQGGLPANLSPYLDMPFYYHYGFHALAAVFTALSGLDIGPAMLLFGQVLNAAIGLSIYTLGKALWKDWRPALIAALLVSFATRMPAYYLSWGRYTLTTGMIFLPLIMAHALKMVRSKHTPKQILTLAVLTAGVLLTHYFAAILLILFFFLLLLDVLITRKQKLLPAMLNFVRVPWGALCGLLLALPWLIRAGQFSISSAGLGANLPESIQFIFDGSGDYIWQLLGPTSNHWLLPIAGIGLLINLIRIKTINFSLWSLIIALMALPWSFTLRPFRPDHFAIVLFLPISLWVGWLAWEMGKWLVKILHKAWVSGLFMIILVGGWIGWSVPNGVDIVNPVTVLVTKADMEGLDWIKENTPADARFYINTSHWLSQIYRGVDGGGWLLPYTGRWALVPTVFYGFSPDTDQVQEIQQWGEGASAITTCSTDFWHLVHEANLSWIYVREGSGSLQPQVLKDCQGVTEIYTNQTVYIYRIEP